MERARNVFDSSEEYEPRQQVFLALLAAAFENTDVPEDRVELKDVVKLLRDEGCNLTPQQARKTLEELGFSRDRIGGKAWIFTGGKDRLKCVLQELKLEDELL